MPYYSPRNPGRSVGNSYNKPSFTTAPASPAICRLRSRQFHLHAVCEDSLGIYGIGTVLSIGPVLQDFASDNLHVFVEGDAISFKSCGYAVGNAETEILERDCHGLSETTGVKKNAEWHQFERARYSTEERH